MWYFAWILGVCFAAAFAVIAPSMKLWKSLSPACPMGASWRA